MDIGIVFGAGIGIGMVFGVLVYKLGWWIGKSINEGWVENPKER